jgi:ABC-type uncharacterized transport system substrate-binding protein
MRKCTALAACVAALVFAQPARAHPHGTVQCGLAVDYKDGQPHRLTGRLLFDPAHSIQASAVLRDPATQKLDDAMQTRFLFGLRQQLARWNWLFGATANGSAADLAELQPPSLWWSSDGRLGITVEMSVTAAAPAEALWVFSCRDPSLYWVSEFLQPETAITLAGCAQAVMSPAIKVATGPQAGAANVEVRCMR